MPRAKKPYLTEKEKEQLLALAGLGLPLPDIANVLGKPADGFQKRLTTDKDLKSIWQVGQSKAQAKVRQTAFQMATKGDCPAMTIFWLKTRAGFRETQRLEISTPTLKTTDVEGMKKDERQALIQKLMHFNEPFEDELSTPPKVPTDAPKP